MRYFTVIFILLGYCIALYAIPQLEQLVLLQDKTTSTDSWMEDNGEFVWISETGRSSEEIFYFDGKKTIQVTDNDVDKTIIDFRNGEILFKDESDGDIDIYLYKEGVITNLSNNDLYDSYVQRYGDRICWMTGLDFVSADNEVYLYENGNVKQITNNDYSEIYPLLNENYLVWIAYGNPDFEDIFFIYEDGNISQLEVDIWGNKFILTESYIIWQGCDGGENCSEFRTDFDHEIFVYDFNEIRQISDSPDREEHVITASNNLIVWYSTGYNPDPKYRMGIYNFSETIIHDASDSFGGLYVGYIKLRDDKLLFKDKVDGVLTLFLFDGTDINIIESGNELASYSYGFTFGGVGLTLNEDGFLKTYLYKDGKKELIFDVLNSYVGFYDNCLTTGYSYPDSSLGKSLLVDPELPYFILNCDALNQLRLKDEFTFNLSVENPGPERAVDVYIIELSGEHPFELIRFLTPIGFKYELYGFKNVALTEGLSMSFDFYSAMVVNIPDEPLNIVSYMVIPTHPGTFIPITAFPSTLNFELIK